MRVKNASRSHSQCPYGPSSALFGTNLIPGSVNDCPNARIERQHKLHRHTMDTEQTTKSSGSSARVCARNAYIVNQMHVTFLDLTVNVCWNVCFQLLCERQPLENDLGRQGRALNNDATRGLHNTCAITSKRERVTRFSSLRATSVPAKDGVSKRHQSDRKNSENQLSRSTDTAEEMQIMNELRIHPCHSTSAEPTIIRIPFNGNKFNIFQCGECRRKGRQRCGRHGRHTHTHHQSQ